MSSEVKEKLQNLHQQQILRKNDIETCHELIRNLKKSVELWFINEGADDEEDVTNSCLEILLHGLRDIRDRKFSTSPVTDTISKLPSFGASNPQTSSQSIDFETQIVNKIITDFEWVRNASKIGAGANGGIDIKINETPNSLHGTTPASFLITAQQSFLHRKQWQVLVSYLKCWVSHNLKEKCLCQCLHSLIADKELLQSHYLETAFLRRETFVTAFLMIFAAYESQQYGLLAQIEPIISRDVHHGQHKRSNSQPNIIVLPKKNEQYATATSSQCATRPARNNISTPLPAIRKIRSLQNFKIENKQTNESDSYCIRRSRCQTIGDYKWPSKAGQTISADSLDNDNLPSTSQCISSRRSKSPISTSTTLNSTASTSISSGSSNSEAKRIHLINTDDIKIWTDQSWVMKQTYLHHEISSAIPTPNQTVSKKPLKSSSPMNSFLSSLFNTPPSYTTWFTDHANLDNEHSQVPETAIDSITPDIHCAKASSMVSSQQHQTPAASPSVNSNVFDNFLPQCGKKLRSRPSLNVLDDISANLDYNNFMATPAATDSTHSNSVTDLKINKSSQPSEIVQHQTAKSCQSLARYLQMSHLSRNNTELEKENAHFRISEAIISAIEHMKWNKLDSSRTKRRRVGENTLMATDCLENSNNTPEVEHYRSVVESSQEYFEEEHLPFAELEENSTDLLSAEVVGLSLISKFDETQLPKVSELKWLVSDDDTPQNLLPMPDLTSSNPDEYILPPSTRGTPWWAPPRPQIIFTDHPKPNRKELLKKQNYRCAGCGVRVAKEYIHSFRYCTYLGKFLCTGCHRNQIAATPAKILQMWDFKCYPVSAFAYRLLEQMYSYPLFNVVDLNPALYIQSTALAVARDKRLRLKFIKDFICLCRFALREKSYFESVPNHLTAEPDCWSMSDFVDAQNKCLQRSIDDLIDKCEIHIFNCVLCTARGFLCENCHSDIVIYPWDKRVQRCDRCGSCFHRNCWKSIEKCCRCQRLSKRKEDEQL